MISYIFAALALILDQITKLYASRGIPLDTGIKPLIPGVLQMTHVRNTGAAFGFLSGSKWLLLGFLVVFTAVVALLIWKGVVRTGFGRFSLLLLLAGALGNGLDRVLYGYVVDMFELLFLPNVIFNLADCFITVGAVLFCVHVILFKTHREDDEDYDDDYYDDEFDEDDGEDKPRRKGKGGTVLFIILVVVLLALIAFFGMYIVKKNYGGSVSNLFASLTGKAPEDTTSEDPASSGGNIVSNNVTADNMSATIVEDVIDGTEVFNITVNVPTGSTIRVIPMSGSLQQDSHLLEEGNTAYIAVPRSIFLPDEYCDSASVTVTPQIEITLPDGSPLTRFLVWTPTGVRSVNAYGVPFATVGLCVVTVATQTEGDTLTAEVLQALASAHIAIGQSEQSFDQETMTYYSDIPCEVI